MQSFLEKWDGYRQTFENYVGESIQRYSVQVNRESIKNLYASMVYSLNGGGKRFRPVLSLTVCEYADQPAKKILPFALAIEMIHTYSLIHDDLPCMDDDEERRGRATNHMVFGETTALLAGDCLLTESFGWIARETSAPAAKTLAAIETVSRLAGFMGMVGGQALDLNENSRDFDQVYMEEVHSKKTACLIQAAVEGAAQICEVSSRDLKTFRAYAQVLGSAFQIKDDLLDIDEGEGSKNLTTILGVKDTEALLKKTSDRCFELLQSLEKPNKFLKELVDYNFNRSE